MTAATAAANLLGIGVEAHDMAAGQAALRAIVIYAATLIIVRLGKKRFMSRASPHDVIVAIMVGSVASRAVTGNAPLLPAIAGVAAILAVHWLLSWAGLRWHGLGRLIKGAPTVVVRDGIVGEAALRSQHMTHDDLAEDLRGRSVDSTSKVRIARVERSGQLSVIKFDAAKPTPPAGRR